MYFKLLKNDIQKNPGNNLVLFLFLTFSAALCAGVFLIIIQLFSSINGLYEKADPPHFLQLHKGEINQDAIDKFNENYKGLIDSQTVPMIDVYGDELTIKGQESYTLKDCRLDIGLVKQNEKRDLLLNEKQEKIILQDGEIGVPVILLDSYPIQLGDTVCLQSGDITKEFVVAEYVYDSQMNSTMCSSTRFLLSDNDFDKMAFHVGEMEYIIEAYFTDKSEAAAYQSAYEQCEDNLPKNGQAVTYTMIFLLSAITDIMVAMIVLFMSILLVLISMFCMRYTILSGIEEEMTQIGTMKAIGIPYKGIRRLYLNKMRLLSAGGCIVGYILALLLSGSLTAHMNRTFGVQPLSTKTLITAFLSSGLIYLIGISYCKKILKKIRKVSICDALVTQTGVNGKKRIDGKIHSAKKMSTSFLLAKNELFRAPGQFSIVIVVMLIASVLVLLPFNIVQTMENKNFTSYMGCGNYDAMIEIEQGEDLQGRMERAESLLQQQTTASYEKSEGIRVLTKNAEGEERSLHIDTGAESGKGLQYIKGRMPQAEEEIALSKLEADDLMAEVGDNIVIKTVKSEMTMKVCGIYQDVTSGGMTAKALGSFPDAQIEKYSFLLTIEDKTRKEEYVAMLQETLGNGYTVECMEAFIEQTLGGVTKQLKTAAYASFVLGAGLILLVVWLFLKLRLIREKAQITMKKVMGVSSSAIRKQELYQVGAAALLGVLLGAVFGNCLGSYPVSAMFSLMGLGIDKIVFLINPFLSWLLIPGMLFIIAMVVCFCYSCKIKNMNDITMLNDD